MNNLYIYIYIYILKHTHIHTHIYIYIYIIIYGQYMFMHMDMYKNITENYDIQTVLSFKIRQNIGKEVKSWVFIDDVT